MGIGSNDDASQNDSITWIENLTTGLRYLLVHPFLPFSRSDFNYQCLFSRKAYCSAEIASPSKILNDYVSTLMHKTQEVYLRNFTSNLVPEVLRSAFKAQSGTQDSTRAHSWLSTLKQIGDYRKISSYNSYLTLGQLLVCTLALSYFLYKDLRVIINRFYNVRQKYAIKLRV